MTSIFIPNIIFIVSVAVLVYWYNNICHLELWRKNICRYCPYCQHKYRGYSQQELERWQVTNLLSVNLSF